MSERPPRLARLIAVVLSQALCLGSVLAADASGAGGASLAFAHEGGALVDTLNSIARQGGLVLTVNAAALDGLRAPAVRGTYTAQEALRRALQGSGWELVHDSGAFYSLRRLPRASGAVGVAQLAPVQVRGRADPLQRAFDAPASVDVVTREQIDRLPPRNASDILAEVTGVHTANDRQSPALVINMRGMQDFGRVTVSIDGARQNFQKSGHGNNGEVYLDPELLAGADVIKGNVQGVGGAGAIAGMVNFRTLSADDLLQEGQRIGGRVNATTGSNAYNFAGSVAVGLKATDDLDFAAAYSRKKVGEFDIGKHGDTNHETAFRWSAKLPTTSAYTRQDQHSGLFKARWRPAPGQELAFGYVGFQTDFDTGVNARSCTTNCTVSGSRNQVRTETATLNYDWARDRLIDLKANVYYARTRFDAEAFDKDVLRGGDTADYNLINIRYSGLENHFETQTLGTSLSNTSRFAFAAMEASLRYGGEYFHDRTRTRDNYSDLTDPTARSGNTPRGTRGVGSAFAYLSVQRGDWLEVGGGLRRDFYRISGQGNMYLGFNDNGVDPKTTDLYQPIDLDRRGHAWLPSLNAAVRATPGLQFFANWGRGMRPPAITESLMSGSHPGSINFPVLPNPYLKTEQSSTWELGLNFQREDLLRDHDKLRLKAAWFNTRVKNYIMNGRVIAPTDAGEYTYLNGQRFAYVNLIDPVRFKGLELKLDYDAGAVFGGLSYTYTLTDMGSARYDPLPYGTVKTVPPQTIVAGTREGLMFFQLVPKKKLALTLGTRLFDRKLTLAARAVHSSGSPVPPSTFGNLSDWRPHTIYDLWAAWQVRKQLTLRLAVQNLRDTRYTEPMGNVVNIAPGRTVLVSANVVF